MNPCGSGGWGLVGEILENIVSEKNPSILLYIKNVLIVLNNTFHNFATKRHGEENCRGIEIYWPHENSSALQLSLNLCTVEVGQESGAYEKKTEEDWYVCVCVLLLYPSPLPPQLTRRRQSPAHY